LELPAGEVTFRVKETAARGRRALAATLLLKWFHALAATVAFARQVERAGIQGVNWSWAANLQRVVNRCVCVRGCSATFTFE